MTGRCREAYEVTWRQIMADEKMRELFASGKTLDNEYRREVLGKLYADVRAKKQEIVGHLADDLAKPSKECAVIYSSMIEKPLRVAAKKDWVKWSWLMPILPDFITTGRRYRQPLGLILIETDPREPFFFAFPRFLASLMAGNPTVLTYAGKKTGTSAYLAELVNADIPQEFGRIAFAGEDIPMEEPDYIFAEEYPGRAVAVFDATANFDKGAEKLIYSWRRMDGLVGVRPEIIYCPVSMRTALIKQLDKWGRRAVDDAEGRKLRVIGVSGDEDLARRLDQEGEIFTLFVFSDEDAYAVKTALDRSFKYASINSVTLRAPSMRELFDQCVTVKTIMMR